MQKLGDIVSERALAAFAGRERELEALAELFEKGGPLAVHVHGVAGIGKSSLLEAFAARARARGARVVRIDCRAVEPTEHGFLAELSEALGDPLSTVGDVVERLSSFDEMVVIALDTYEVFRLLDTWVRQVFVPSLPVNARVAIASRNPPSPAWRTAPGWQGLFRSLQLEPLSEMESLEYLARSGVEPDIARQINRLVRGHPLALGMAASIVLSDGGRTIEETGHQVIDELSRSYIDAVPDGLTRQALEACSLVRCITEPLLHALLPGTPPRDTMERLAALPFAEAGREGLFIHDAVRSAIAGSLAARDPDSHREYRRAAWAYLQDRLRRAHGTEPWRYTADLLFLIENPVLREGFFPSGPHPLAVEPATLNDEAVVHRIIEEKAAPERDALFAWWRCHQEAFRIVRDRDGTVRGLCVMVRASDLNGAVDLADPVAAAWRRDAAPRDLSATLFCRRWLDRDVGEAPSASQAASWVDLKRSYVEMRGTLRWVYTVVANPEPYAAVATKLGFRPLAQPTAEVGGQTMYSILLDMGPGSVDAWLTALVGAEITADDVQSSKVLDVDAHELVLTSGRVGLTSLEFGVMRYLQDRPGKAISRYDLMEAVWGYRSPTASNVVDVVVRSLRRKLGAEAHSVETVRGTGYRYRVPV
ncbi:MAG TPA: winged helix-turn-helix domain-containing protein [Vicinamibacterales bacterium]|nr:winged helix-turn-helix domain-containing protein [Vicinamibacterales bacterium]